MLVNPIELRGNWDKGFAIDYHVIQSIYLGDNEYGRPEFETTRSEIGELVYQLKYKQKKDVVYDIIELINPFLNRWKVLKDIDLIIPIPPTNKNRPIQPVFLISKAISESLYKPIAFDILEKNNDHQVKDLNMEEKENIINGSIVKHKKFTRKVNLLLVDDLYKSGSTLNEVCNILRNDINVNKIYVLVMTKTRR